LLAKAFIESRPFSTELSYFCIPSTWDAHQVRRKVIVSRMNAGTLKIMKEPAFQKIPAATGSDCVGDTPENFAAFVQDESAKFVKENGATVD
jgi:hypothetical protein